jgi:hypothetical protein
MSPPSFPAEFSFFLFSSQASIIEKGLDKLAKYRNMASAPPPMPEPVLPRSHALLPLVGVAKNELGERPLPGLAATATARLQSANKAFAPSCKLVVVAEEHARVST